VNTRLMHDAHVPHPPRTHIFSLLTCAPPLTHTLSPLTCAVFFGAPCTTTTERRCGLDEYEETKVEGGRVVVELEPVKDETMNGKVRVWERRMHTLSRHDERGCVCVNVSVFI
jgi:hypothetical protein